VRFSRSSSLQPLGVAGLHAPVLITPTVPGRLRDLQVPDDLLEALTLAEDLLPLGELADDLVGRGLRRFIVCRPPSS
jgi:hypothetical protein